MRPVSHEEHVSTESRNMVSFDSDDDAVLYLSNKGKTMTFDLDKVFPPQATQEEVSLSRGTVVWTSVCHRGHVALMVERVGW